MKRNDLHENQTVNTRIIKNQYEIRKSSMTIIRHLSDNCLTNLPTLIDLDSSIFQLSIIVRCSNFHIFASPGKQRSPRLIIT